MNHWSARIAGQSSVFRGASTVGIMGFAPGFPSARAIGGAVYVAKVTGGISGTFSVSILGKIGQHGSAATPEASVAGTTVYLAGVTGIAAAGTYVLVPFGYSASGTPYLSDVVPVVNRIDQIVPPASVVFEGTNVGVGIGGVSAHIAVNACIWLG